MQTLRRTVGVLIFPAVAWLGTGCERTDTPTGARPMASIVDPGPCSVPSIAYPTIQSAVNDVTCNPINVAAGTYPEPTAPGPLTIFRTVTLLGAQSGIDARGRVGLESIVTDPQGTYVTANNVVIDGFTFENSTNGSFTGYGIAMGAGTSGTQVLNNIVQNNIAGIALSNTGGSQVLIRHNQIQSNNQTGAASGTGIYTDQFVSGGAVTNVLIEENAFIGNDDAGIDVSNTALPGVSNLDVSTNSFNLNGRAVVLFNTHMSTIHDNSITNSTLVGSAAVRLFDNNSDLSILNNDIITGVTHAIRLSVLGLVGGPSSNVVIHENNIEFFAGDGLLVSAGGHVGKVNAECNWWNSSTGPMNPSNPGGTGEKVEGDADFTPWLTAPAPGGSCIGGLGLHGMVTGGGQITVSGGSGSFGFSAKDQTQSGHLDYMNHVSGAHLNCTVTSVMITPPNKAKLSGPCSSKNAGGATSFTADVEDNDKTSDKFTISYGTVVNEGGTIRSGNIQIK